MDKNEDHLAEAERHVREGERHIADLKARIVALENEGQGGAVVDSKILLRTMEETQRLQVEHLERERAERNENSEVRASLPTDNASSGISR